MTDKEIAEVEDMLVKKYFTARSEFALPKGAAPRLAALARSCAAAVEPVN